jgi:hypothetical protein
MKTMKNQFEVHRPDSFWPEMSSGDLTRHISNDAIESDQPSPRMRKLEARKMPEGNNNSFTSKRLFYRDENDGRDDIL